MKTLVLLTDFGRGGSFFAHGLLAQHPDILTTETFIEDKKFFNDTHQLSSKEIQMICEIGTDNRASIWLQDEGVDSELIKDHNFCSCKKNISSNGVILLHVHSMLTFGNDIYTILKDFENNHNFEVKIILTYRNFEESLTSWVKRFNKLSLRRFILYLFFILRLRENSKNFLRLSAGFKIKFFKLEDFYSDPQNEFINLLKFIDVPDFLLSNKIILRNTFYKGGANFTKEFDLFNMQYRIDQLKKVDLSKIELLILKWVQSESNFTTNNNLIKMFLFFIIVIFMAPIVFIDTILTVVMKPLILIIRQLQSSNFHRISLGQLKDSWLSAFILQDYLKLVNSVRKTERWV